MIIMHIVLLSNVVVVRGAATVCVSFLLCALHSKLLWGQKSNLLYKHSLSRYLVVVVWIEPPPHNHITGTVCSPFFLLSYRGRCQLPFS
jgi:hypothetical protein